MKSSNATYKFLGNIIIPSIIGIGLVGIPTVCLIFKFRYPDSPYGWIFVVFICFIVIERVWETFYSTGENKRYKLQGDWTLPLVSIAYELMLFGIIFEHFLIKKQLNLWITAFALLIYGLSCIFRVWGMMTLKEQWAVHAVGAQKVKDAFLVQAGPYKYVRHPIYFGVILEVISIPLIWNAYFVVVFTIVINVPLQIVRAYFEEKASIRKLGREYISYRNSVPALFPVNFRNTNKK